MKEVAGAQKSELRRMNILPQVQHLVAARLVEGEAKSRAEFRTWRWLSLGAAVAAAAAIVLVVVSLQRAPFLTFRIDGPFGQSGSLLAPPAGQAQAAVFSDGSRVVVGDRSNARIDSVDADGATVILDDGHLDASIVHRPSTRWTVRAGDYRIRVTGTRFSTAWDRRSKELTVRLFEGSVEVTGPGVPAAGAKVRAGHVLRASARGATLAVAEPIPAATVATPVIEPMAAPAAAPEAATPSAPVVEVPAVAPAASMAPLPTAAPGSRFHRTAARPVSPVPAPAAAAGAPSATTASWRSLARHALYRDALAVAVGEGFDAQCEQLRAEDLVLLGDVARLGGDTRRADQAYRAALRRFPGLDRPAFSLGVMSFEARHDYRDAASWLSRYLREHPTGPLATEAAGRLLEAWDLAGETTKAREAARAYLRDHPTGPHRGLARRLAGP
jgi:hypothetical protein